MTVALGSMDGGRHYELFVLVLVDNVFVVAGAGKAKHSAWKMFVVYFVLRFAVRCWLLVVRLVGGAVCLIERCQVIS